MGCVHCLLKLIKTDQRTRSALFPPSYGVDVGKLTSIPLVQIASAFYFSLNLECVLVFFSFSRTVLTRLFFPAIRNRRLMYPILDQLI